MTIVQKFTTANKCYKNATKITVKGIVLHSTGTPQPSADKYFAAFNNPNVSKAVHAFVEPSGYVMQTLPWNYKAWHCGGAYNSDHIGIEMTEPASIRYSGGATFTDNNPAVTLEHVKGTYKVAVELVAMLCKQFALNPLVPGVIVSHSEEHKMGKASGHADVEHIWKKYGMTMDQFRRDVQTAMNGGTVITTPVQQQTTGNINVSNNSNTFIYQVKLKSKDSKLNIRETPGGTVIGTLAHNTLVIVQATAGEWKKISAGWVSGNYLVPFNNGFHYTAKLQTIYIKVDSLNVRSTPEIKNGNVVGTLQKGKKYPIVGTCNGFGLLANGAGNVSMSPKSVSAS